MKQQIKYSFGEKEKLIRWSWRYKILELCISSSIVAPDILDRYSFNGINFYLFFQLSSTNYCYVIFIINTFAKFEARAWQVFI